MGALSAEGLLLAVTSPVLVVAVVVGDARRVRVRVRERRERRRMDSCLGWVDGWMDGHKWRIEVTKS